MLMLSAPLTDQLRLIANAVAIASPTRFTFAGRDYDALASQPAAGALQTSPGVPLVAALRDCLYARCYCKPFAGVEPPAAAAPPTTRELTLELSAANAGQPRWDSGWQITRMEPSGQVFAQKGGRARSLWPGEFLTFDGPGVPPRVGSQVSVYFPHESRTMQPGFYFAFSEVESDPADESRLTRFYWNVCEQGAVPLTGWITQTLNRFQIPFRYKCLTIAGQFERVDAAVLYVSKKFFRISAELLATGRETLREFLRPETPLFTRHLAPGLAFAEDPGNGESFGMNRCRILAEALWSAASKGLVREDQRFQEVTAHFTQYGLRLDQAHLNAQSADFYETPEFA
jgi:type III HopA1-like effector protein